MGLIGAGGAIGSVARYLLSVSFARSDFPWGTLVVNALGCFLIGLLLFGGLNAGWLTPGGRAFLAVGILGGFTTMSSFTFETIGLFYAQRAPLALANVGTTLAACLGGTWLGHILAARLWPPGA